MERAAVLRTVFYHFTFELPNNDYMSRSQIVATGLWFRISTVLKLVRFGNVVMMGAAVILGQYLVTGAGFVFGQTSTLIPAFAAALLGAAGNVLNDVMDVDRDRINHPNRPLPAGLIKTRSALFVALGCFLTSVAFALTLTSAQIVVFGVATLLLFVYSVRLSSIPLGGNLAVSFTVALSIPFGALDHTLTTAVFVASGFAFLATLAREIMKDIQDLKGDEATGARTLAAVLGQEKGFTMVRLLSAGIVLCSVIPFITSGFGGLYLILIALTDVFLLKTWLGPTSHPKTAQSISSSLKWAMLTGLIALAFVESVPTY